MLTKCVNCSFYVRRNDEFCLNCGIESPAENKQQNLQNYYTFYDIFQSKIFKIFISYLLAAIPVYFTFDILISIFPKSGSYIWFLAFISWLFLSLFIVYLTHDFRLPKRISRNNKNQNNLRSKSKIIENRISDLNSRVRQIDILLNRIKETDNQNLQEIRRKLMLAREIVVSHFARYELQKQKIELVRLQNGVAPYLESLQHLNDGETENGLVMIEITQAEIDKMRRNLTNDMAIEFPAATLREKDGFLAQIADTKNSCEQLREALLSRQAVRALQDVSPLRESLQMPHSKELIHAAETFNIQTTLTDFSESFDELEREYKRLRAENEIGEKLLAE